MSHRSSLRLPFVATVAGVSAVAACGGTAVVDPSSSGGASSSGAGGAGGATSNGSTTTGSSTTSSGSGGQPSGCPTSSPDGYTTCELPPEQVCTYDVSCQSGEVSLSFSCVDGWWEIVEQACAQPYDSCPGTDYYCDGTWLMPHGTNPPAPCPSDAPTAGSDCFAGGMGGTWEKCGYQCDDGSTWTIATCSPSGTTEGTWGYDGACP